MDPRIIELYDDFTHRHLDRRLFLERLTSLVGSAAAASALLPLLDSNPALAQMVPETDARISVQTVTFAGSSGDVKAYVARPAGSDRRPGVIVIHENRGLQPHIQDVARRFAVAGYVALAPDLMSQIGGTPSGSEDEARTKFAGMKPDVAIADLVKALAYLRSRPDATGKAGVVGFCWGGGMTARLAAAAPDVNAAVVFYGPVPPADEIAKMKAPMLLNYAGIDPNINPKLPEFEAGLKAANVPYTLYVYEGVNHAFHNDTGAARYNEAAAKLAWQRTVEFFDKQLKGA
jgi:carboxymethylenebutenolidase